MRDLISRQAAIEALVAETIYTEEELKEYYEANSYRNEWVNGIHEAVEVIKQLPPAQPAPSQVAADIARIVENGQDTRVIAPPVIIRSKDCKYRGVGDYCVYGTRLAWVTKSNDFCSKAERRTDG